MDIDAILVIASAAIVFIRTVAEAWAKLKEVVDQHTKK